MFGERGRLIALDQRVEPVEVGFVERTLSTDGQTDAVQGQRVVLADAAQEVVEGPAVDHVVLGVHFEETDVRARFERVPEVLGFEADARTCRQPWSSASCLHGWPHLDQAFFSLNSAVWPKPVGELLEAVFSQVPLGTSDQALPW